MTVREDFSARTLRMLAAQAGYYCANPDCVHSTSGRSLDESRAVNIGVGINISAASPGGKRYDPNTATAERRIGANGIWLCPSCSKLIDSDEQRFTVALLHHWKDNAVQGALDEVASGGSLGLVRASFAPDAADEEFLRGLDLPSGDMVDVVSAGLRSAAQTDIAAFRAARVGPAHTLALTLRLRNCSSPNVTLECVARLTSLAEPIVLVSPGGTGKSITLVQLGEHLGAEDGAIPLLVPLGEWSERQEDFFAFILRRDVFGPFRRQHLMQLAYYGGLVLLLDGWNELGPEARRRAASDIAALRRDYPQLRFVFSSRREMMPVSGPVIEIDTLSQDQQLEIARAVRGEEGVALVERAWRTPGVREFVGIPIYMNALLTLPSGVGFPQTKEAVLRTFVQDGGRTPNKVEQLLRDTFGQHTVMLVSLAVEANRSATTVISDSIANRTISTVLRKLSDRGQFNIGATPQPRAVADGLVDAHLLVRGPGANGAIRFQHQLFQEWYAAAEVEQLMLEATAGNADARRRLREDILNWSNWEESILFACDRLSRASDDGARAVATVIDDTLGIDPLLAAAMLDRASDAVWQRVRDRVVRFVRKWHTPAKIDRAVRFMITSGKPEFADLVWPLSSNTDDQIQIETFRVADRFRTSVLGPERDARLRALPSPKRKIALSEIASQSGFDGMDLATTLASTDHDPSVVVAVVESLAFRQGDRHVNRIMRTASDAVWSALGTQDYSYRFTDTLLDERLKAERVAARAAEIDPVRVLIRLAEDNPVDAASRVATLVGAADEDINEPNFELAVAQAYRKYPGAVAAGLTARIATGLSLPYRIGDYLVSAPLLDTGPLAEAALEPSTPEHRLRAIAAVIGPVTAAALFDQLIAVVERIFSVRRYDGRLSNARRRLVRALTATRQDVFVRVVRDKGRTNDPRHIGLLADLMASHGHDSDGTKPPIDAAHSVGLCALVEGWIETLRIAPQPERQAASEVARAAERLADAELAEPLRCLLERDLSDYATARAAPHAARGHASGVDEEGYTLLYARAFAAMHDAPAVILLKRALADVRWGIYAAGALHEIWSADHPPEERRIFGAWTDFSQHLARKAERAGATPPSSEFAEAIFAVVRMLGESTKSDVEQLHAIALAEIGLALPHGAKRQEIDALLGLPQPIPHKHRLLVATVRSGEVIPVAFVMDGLRNLLDAAQTETWRLDESRGILMGWIDLFPFTEDQEKVHEALALLPEQRRRPQALHRLLRTLPQSPAASALVTVARLAADDPAFFQEFEWMNALVKLDTEAAALLLLDHLCAGRIPVRDGVQLSTVLAGWARKRDTVRNEITARYRALPTSNISRVLEMAMNDLADAEEVFMMLFDAHVDGQVNIHFIAGALQNLVMGRKPSQEWAGAFEDFGLPPTGLRARLFSMLAANDARAKLAKHCLITIDEYRDEHGQLSDEPRHPDITLGQAWPSEADEPLE